MPMRPMIKNVELALRVTHMHQSQLSRSALSQSQQPAERGRSWHIFQSVRNQSQRAAAVSARARYADPAPRSRSDEATGAKREASAVFASAREASQHAPLRGLSEASAAS